MALGVGWKKGRVALSVVTTKQGDRESRVTGNWVTG